MAASFAFHLGKAVAQVACGWCSKPYCSGFSGLLSLSLTDGRFVAQHIELACKHQALGHARAMHFTDRGAVRDVEVAEMALVLAYHQAPARALGGRWNDQPAGKEQIGTQQV